MAQCALAKTAMLLQTNSYIVPKEKRAAHNHLMQRFRQVLMKIGCDHFEVFEQVGANWAGGETSGRFVQMMKFRDRKHCQAVQLMERKDPAAQALVREFCDLINFNYQEQQGLFAHGYYQATIEPIKLGKSTDLAYNAFAGEEAPFDPDAKIEPPTPAVTAAKVETDDESAEHADGPSMSDLLRKPVEGETESDPADDGVLAIDDLTAPDDAETPIDGALAGEAVASADDDEGAEPDLLDEASDDDSDSERTSQHST